MASLIPALGACASRMTSGERRLAERLEQKLDDDYLLWYDVPIGPKQTHPDFVLLHPRRGLLILETKDWKLETIQRANRQAWDIMVNGQLKVVINPLAQARHCAMQVVNALERDPQLVQSAAEHQGKLSFPWGHGVAGSGKTMILGYRAEYLARASTATTKPVLILCFNEPLAVKLASVMEAKGLISSVHVRHFHKWCRDQLVAFGQSLPPFNMPVTEKMLEMVQRVIHGVERQQIPSGQYQAELIDEGHDFAPEWLKLVTQMVDPATNSLLVLFDDAQSLYERSRSKQFSFKSVGIAAQGRTTILKINYRNTQQILQTASLIASDLLTADDKDDDGIPLLHPISCGRDGEAPLIIRLPSLREEAYAIADHLTAAHQEGHAWGDMAILCRDWNTMDLCAAALRQRQLPHHVRKKAGDFKPDSDSIQIMTMHASKGLEFPVVALPGVGHMPAAGEDEKEAARVFYVAATRATQRLVIGIGGAGGFGQRLGT